MSASAEARAEQRIGQLLKEKYRLERVLGVGGMAAVYQATHRNRSQVAIKLLHPELSLLDDVRSRFLREGYVANSVKHAGAVAVLDDDVSEDGSAFLVMELLEGLALDRVWENRGQRLSLAASLAVGKQLLGVLSAAHAREIVHRDLKPGNLFVKHDGQLKVLDFGIARLRDANTNHAVTGTGAMLGTPVFMAPEQALGKTHEVDAQSDLWAAGATLFTLLSGEYVHRGDNPAQVLIRCATVPARSLADAMPGAPRPVIELVDRALAFEKSARWPTAEAMHSALLAAQSELFGATDAWATLAGLFSPTNTASAPRQSVAPPRTETVPGLPTPVSLAPTHLSGPPLPPTRPSGQPPAPEQASPQQAAPPPASAQHGPTSTAVPVTQPSAGEHPASPQPRRSFALLVAALTLAGVGAWGMSRALHRTTAEPGGSATTLASTPVAPTVSVVPLVEPTASSEQHRDPDVPGATPSASASSSTRRSDLPPPGGHVHVTASATVSAHNPLNMVLK